MAIESHLQELVRKHGDIERMIEEAMMHPSIDDLEISELKRRKLMLKDQIAKLEGDGETRH
ncbi:MAG: DUF465 domain-containing protein [Brucellaceae bacterium]|nr:DUF465 domain-containing protein [Brucellaceae bacterium]